MPIFLYITLSDTENKEFYEHLNNGFFSGGLVVRIPKHCAI